MLFIYIFSNYFASNYQLHNIVRLFFKPTLYVTKPFKRLIIVFKKIKI